MSLARRTLWVPLVAFWVGAPAAAPAQLSAEEIELKVVLEEEQGAMVDSLRGWVEVNTGTWNRAGLERFAEMVREPLVALGFDVSVEPGPEIDLPGHAGATTGPLLVARRAAEGAADAEPLRLLLVGHYDTVFEPDSSFQHFSPREEDPRFATGPGVSDMKGGLVVMLYALRALATTGDLSRATWTILLNADEEIGSLGSRPRLEAEARAADIGFVFESARESGGMVRSRRGLGQFHLTVEGVAAHAGNAHEKGRSAIREMAHKILRIESLTDYDRGVTLNVGTVDGGTKRNIVPERARAWIDLRYDDVQAGEEARRELERIAGEVFVEGTRTVLWGTLHRPPKPATPELDELLERHGELAQALGVAIPPPVHAGGGTDGSLMSAVGLPSLDSLGVVGGAAHTTREFVDLASLWQRAAVAAVLLRRLIRGELYADPEGG